MFYVANALTKTACDHLHSHGESHLSKNILGTATRPVSHSSTQCEMVS